MANEFPSVLNNATPSQPVVDLMTKWALNGWVPSIISDLSSDLRLFAEVWLSNNNIPYSNLLMGVTSYTDAVKWTGCSIMITTRPLMFINAVVNNPELEVYVIMTMKNDKWLEESGLEPSQDVLDRIHMVKDVKQIERIESGKMRRLDDAGEVLPDGV
jgi:hypothetical protein